MAGQDIVTTIPRQHFKTIFTMLNGRPDSRVKIFTSPLQVNLRDIYEINQRIASKLNTHHLEGVVVTVKVGYRGERFDEFGSWESFTASKWETTERVEEIVLKWDFCLNLVGEGRPQQHSLLVRISTDFKAASFFQYLASAHRDEEIENIDIDMAPGFCRVDYMNAQISKELLNEVTEWFAARKQPKLIPDFWYECKKRKNSIAKFFHHWIYLSQSLLLIAGYYALANLEVFSASVVQNSVAYLIFSVYFLTFPASKISHFFGEKIFEKLSNIEGSKVVFDFTEGDKKFADERFQENQKKGKSSFMWIISQVIINIVSSFLSWLMLP